VIPSGLLQILDSALLVFLIGIVVKLYSEHVDMKAKIDAMWSWWMKMTSPKV
jgi:hypothetical protein